MATTLHEKCDTCRREICEFCNSQEHDPYGAPTPTPRSAEAWGRFLRGLHMGDDERQAAVAKLHTDERLPASRGRHEDAGKQLEVDVWCKRLHE